MPIKKIAAFDLDGTITRTDSFFRFLKFACGIRAVAIGFILLWPVLLAYKLKLMSNARAKELVLTWFFRGTEIDKFNELCEKFALESLPEIVYPEALKRIKKHQEEGLEVVIVSASLENYVKPWAKSVEAECLATRMEVTNRRLSGSYGEGGNCYGPEKAERLKSHYAESEFKVLYAYGDSRGDKEMLQMADKSYYKPFK
jgi:phosphatidylglycerophosphatase C